MNRGITLFDYLAFNADPAVRSAARNVVESYGYTFSGRDERSLLNGLKGFVRREGEGGLKALSQIHPDRDLILSGLPANMGADGFQSVSQPVNQSASQSATTSMYRTTDHTQLLIAGFFVSALLLATAIISKK